MKKRLPVSKIMTTPVLTVNHTNSLHDVKNLFEKNHIHHLPVVSGDKLVGLISRTDLARISYVADASSDELSTAMYDILSIEKVMVQDVKTISVEATVHEAIETFLAHDFHALPVLKDGKIAGILSTHDLLKFLNDQF